MANTVTQTATPTAAALKDPRLFRQPAISTALGFLRQPTPPSTSTIPPPAKSSATVAKLGAAETRTAIEAANAAFPAWSKRTAKSAPQVLRRWFELMMENQEDLARLMTLEQGKPLTESKGEVAYAAAFLNGSAKKPSAFTATPFPAIKPISASSSSSSPSASSPASLRGISRSP
jgi:succinate-semialdehyde dehydrogenase/glutarate-semialdehyde dehydrogenase